MKPYKGIIRIECRLKKGGCLRNLNKNVQPGCMDCPEAETQILDLEDKPIYKYHSPIQKTGRRIKKK